MVYLFFLITADADTKRLSRLVAVLTLLQTKRLVTASELAKRFEVSVRTIYRDMRSLAEAGIPLLTEEGKGYRLLESYRLPPVMLSEQEANAIITAQHILSGNKDASLVAAYQAAVDKIKAVLSRSTRDRTNLLASRMRTYSNDPSAGGGTFLAALQLALTHYQLVEIHYRSSTGQPSRRRVEPFALLLSS